MTYALSGKCFSTWVFKNKKTKTCQHLDLGKVLQAEQARFTEEFAKLERQFNDVRREHTKAVVALRQAERQAEREKEKSAEQLSLQQKEYEMILEKSQSQARQLEKERNMLMATVRQEGFKVPRLRPKEFSGKFVTFVDFLVLPVIQSPGQKLLSNYVNLI